MHKILTKSAGTRFAFKILPAMQLQWMEHHRSCLVSAMEDEGSNPSIAGKFLKAVGVLYINNKLLGHYLVLEVMEGSSFAPKHLEWYCLLQQYTHSDAFDLFGIYPKDWLFFVCGIQ